MQILRDNKSYELTTDELFAAYQEQLLEYFYQEASMQIAQLVNQDSLKTIPPEMLEDFTRDIASAGFNKYLKIDCTRQEAIELVLN